MVSSVGWLLIIMSVIFVFLKPAPGVLFFAVLGAGMVWLQLRGKRIHVDTATKTVNRGRHTHKIQDPVVIFINKVKVAQTVNARSQSTNVKTFFYKAYLLDGEAKVLLSSNRKVERDLKKLKDIAADLKVELQLP